MQLTQHLSRQSPRNLALIVFGMMFGGTCAVMAYLYVGAVRHREEDIRIYVRELAIAAAGLVDVELHEQLVRPDQLASDVYTRVLSPLVKFHLAHPNIQYVWTTRVKEDGRQLFLLETATDDRIRRQQTSLGRSQDILAFLDEDPPTEAGRKTIPILRSGAALVLDDIYTDSHGSYIEARAPLQDRTGRFLGYLGVDYALDRYQERIDEVRITGLVTLALALAVSALVASLMGEMRRQTLANLEQIQRAESEMRRQRDLAAKANAAKGELLRIASHDLKNPLSAIAGLAGLQLQSVKSRPDPASHRDDIEGLETIQASAKHMSEIVRGILVGEGLEQGGMPYQPVPVDLSALCAEVIRFNQMAAQKKQIALRAEIAAGLSLAADAKLLREAIDNYLSNAIKYTPVGGSVTVSCQARPADGLIEFAVQDTGPGLSPADQAKLFRKFQKLTPRPTGGETSTGLGLSIVKTIVERHQGQVGCESAVGQGARFWLRLPARPTV